MSGPISLYFTASFYAKYTWLFIHIYKTNNITNKRNTVSSYRTVDFELGFFHDIHTLLSGCLILQRFVCFVNNWNKETWRQSLPLVPEIKQMAKPNSTRNDKSTRRNKQSTKVHLLSLDISHALTCHTTVMQWRQLQDIRDITGTSTSHLCTLFWYTK